MMATDNLIQALAKQRTIGDWSQKYRPLLNPPSRSAALSQVLRAPGIASGGIYGAGANLRGDGGSGVDQSNFTGTASVGGPLGSFGRAALGGLGMIPGFGLATGFTRGMNALGYRGVSGPTAPRPQTAAFRAVVDAGDRAADARTYERGVDAQEAYAGDAMRAYERDYGGDRNGGDRNGGSRRDRDRAGLGGDPNQSGPR